MKQRRSLLLALAALLCVIGVSGGLLLRGYRREQANRELILAIQSNDTPRGLAALQAHADPNVRDTTEASSSFGQNLSVLWRQMRGLDPPDPPSGQTALILAVQQDNTVLAEALLARGARDTEKVSPTFIPLEDDTAWPVPLLMIAVQKHNISLMQALVQHGSDVNSVDNDHKTALFYAEDATMVKALLACGANVNATAPDGSRPLMSRKRSGIMHNIAIYLRHKTKHSSPDSKTDQR